MMRIFLAAALAALLAAPAHAQEPPRRSTVSVIGTGEVQLKPDFAHLHASVMTQGDTVAQVVDANRAATERVLARLQAVGVKREDVQTTDLQVSQTPPRLDREGREVRVPKFTATHQLRVKSRDLEGVGKLAGEMLSVGDLLFHSLSWGLDRQDEGRDEARRAAVRDARRQAQVYAEAAEIRLGRIVEIRDAAGPPHDTEFAMRASAPAAAPGIPVIPPATVRSTAAVQMVWEIAP